MGARRLVVIAATGLVAGGALYLALSGGETPQPARFPHDKHPLLQCALCHPGVRAEAPPGGSGHAGLPALGDCLRCHARPTSDRVWPSHWWREAEEGTTVYFRAGLRLPTHTRFSHRRHVVEGRLDCVSCHGDIRRLSVPPPRPLVRVKMADCVACHKQERVTTDCNACHR